MQITHDGQKYELNVERAIELEVLKRKARPIRISEIPNGAVFQWRNRNDGKVQMTYIMLNNRLTYSGQCVTVEENPRLTHLVDYYTDSFFYLDTKTNKWVGEISE